MRVVSDYQSNVYLKNDMYNLAFLAKFKPERFNSHRAIGPISRYFQNMFNRSAVASKKIWFPKNKNIESSINEINLKSSGGINEAWEMNPDNRKKYVIIIHGLGHNISRLQDLYENILNKTKFGILAPEYRNLTKQSEESNKLFKAFSYKAMEEDFQAPVNYLVDKGIKENDIFVLGNSFGGYPASIVGKNNENIGGVMLLATINSFESIYDNIIKGTKKQIPKYIKFFIKHFNICRNKFKRTYRTEDLLEDTKVPVDIIHAEDDALIDIKYIKHLGEKCKNLKSFIKLKTGNHRMDKNKINAVVDLLNTK